MTQIYFTENCTGITNRISVLVTTLYADATVALAAICLFLEGLLDRNSHLIRSEAEWIVGDPSQVSSRPV